LVGPTFMATAKPIENIQKTNKFLSAIIKRSTDIVSGTIISKESYWVKEGKSQTIYTKMELKVANYTKSSDKRDIETITYLGGSINGTYLLPIYEPWGSMNPEIGDTVKIFGIKNKGIIESQLIETISNPTPVLEQGSSLLTWTPTCRVDEDMKIGFYMISIYHDGGYYSSDPRATWDPADFPIDYYVNPSDSGVNPSYTDTAIQLAMDSWVGVQSSTVDWNFVDDTNISYESYGDGNVIFWDNTGPDWLACIYLWGDYSTGQIHEFDIQMNSYYTWSINPDSGEYDIQSVATHEAGHAIGLGDLNNDNQWEAFDDFVMWYGLWDGEIKRNLGTGDIRGAQYAYSQYDQPTVSISSPSDSGTVTRGTSFQIQATASCSDSINSVQFKMTRKAVGSQIEDSGWTSMTLSGGYWTASYTPYSGWTLDQYYVIVRALSDRGTATQRIYGYDWHTVTLQTDPQTINDNFENFSTGWTTDTGGSGTVTKSSSHAHGGTYAARIYAPSTSDYAYCYKSLPGYSNHDFHLQIWFYVDNSVTTSLMFACEQRGSSGVQNRIVVTDDSGTCRVKYLKTTGSGYDPSSYTSICSVSYNAWHKIDLTWHNSQQYYTILIDDANSTNFSPRSTAISVTTLYIGDSSVAGYRGIVYYDDLLVEPV
jgi:hypothetical protein